MRRKLFLLMAGVCLVGLPVAAQPAGGDAAADYARLQEVVRTQFGEAFTVYEGMTSPVLIGDLNGDGIEDAVIIARMENPLLDQKDLGYKVIDPHHGYFGFGDPEVTLRFGSVPGRPALALLVIHGVGEEAWRAAAPRDKFVIVNLPFESLRLGRAMYRKRPRPALLAEEGGRLTSSVFWDGRRYRYEPNFEMN